MSPLRDDALLQDGRAPVLHESGDVGLLSRSTAGLGDGGAQVDLRGGSKAILPDRLFGSINLLPNRVVVSRQRRQLGFEAATRYAGSR
ncbi:hypothetical protein ACP70R_018477 [Stipagrostis hirtigluma subsp. patula]